VEHHKAEACPHPKNFSGICHHCHARGEEGDHMASNRDCPKYVEEMKKLWAKIPTTKY